MGHHIPKGDMSVLVYSRDGILDPDRPRGREVGEALEKEKKGDSVRILFRQQQ